MGGIYNFKFVKTGDERFRERSVTYAKSALDEAGFALISANKQRILIKLECNWVGAAKRWQEARDCYRKVLEVRRNGLAHLNLAASEAQLGNRLAAMHHLKEYMATNPPQCRSSIRSAVAPLAEDPSFKAAFEEELLKLSC